MLNLIFFLMKCLAMILCIPFLTLFERKVLSYSQSRKGPKKVSIMGLLQPLADGMKLIMKEFGFPKFSNSFGFFFSPILLFFLMIFSLVTLSKIFNGWSFSYSVLLFLLFSSISMFSLFFSAMSSNSKYTLLGAFRGSAQVISYEISMMLVLLIPCCLSFSLKFSKILFKYKFSFVMFPLMFIFWIISMVAETNRAPLDFAEGESELVSGFKTEFGSLEFTFLFLGEYGKMIISSMLTSIMFFGNMMFMSMLSVFFLFLFVWFRTTFPRFRYDLFMNFSWKVILPISFLLFFIMFF